MPLFAAYAVSIPPGVAWNSNNAVIVAAKILRARPHPIMPPHEPFLHNRLLIICEGEGNFFCNCNNGNE